MRIPLGGVDAFHLVTDRVMRGRGLAGNHTLFAVQVAGRLDLREVERRLARAVEGLPELRRRLVRTPAGPAWAERGGAAPEIRVRAVGTGGLDDTLAEILDAPLDGDALWGAELVRGEDHDVFVWKWFHSFTDAKGAERFVTWLGSGDGAGPVEPPPMEERTDTGTRPLAKLDRKARLEATRTYGNHMLKLARTPIVSLSTLADGALGRTRVTRVRLTEEETKAFDKTVRERARLAESSVMVLASARVYDRIVRGRGLAPAQHLVPVPMSLDPKVGATRMFGNNLTMMTFALRRDDLGDTARAVASLADQQRAIVRDKLDVGMLASMELAKAVPPGIYHWFITRPFGGEVSSFVFSNPGAVGLATFAGQKVTDAFALPSVATPPGFQIIFTRHGGRLAATAGHVEGALSPAEERALASQIRAELLGPL